MNDNQLEHLIGKLRAEKPPGAPACLEQDVWRQIARRTAPASSWLQVLAGFVFRAPVALPLIAGAALLGVTLAVNVAAPSPSTSARYSQALDFGSITDTDTFELFHAR